MAPDDYLINLGVIWPGHPALEQLVSLDPVLSCDVLWSVMSCISGIVLARVVVLPTCVCLAVIGLLSTLRGLELVRCFDFGADICVCKAPRYLRMILAWSDTLGAGLSRSVMCYARPVALRPLWRMIHAHALADHLQLQQYLRRPCTSLGAPTLGLDGTR